MTVVSARSGWTMQASASTANEENLDMECVNDGSKK
jgi:hypothetical protein